MSYFTLHNLWIIIRQIADIVCVWALVYYCLKIVKNNSRTIQIFKGILLVIIIKAVATYLELNTIAALTATIMNWGVPAIIIIFQPEIRSILEKIGKTSVFSRISTLTVNERENLVDELVKACSEMSKTKTGALISIEQGHSLSDFIKTGTPMNSVVSSELLCSIFQYGTPLHDGAVIIQGVKIACAAAYFPPTSKELPTSYGARHRAAVGISEITDSITIIVSEETGNISIAQGGALTVYSEASLREFLMKALGAQDEKPKEEKEGADDASQTEEDKKVSVFSHYFKGKNRHINMENAPKYSKKKKDKKRKKANTDSNKDKIKIENLAAAQDEPLDQLFENIVDSNDVMKNDKEEVKEVNKQENNHKENSVVEVKENKVVETKKVEPKEAKKEVKESSSYVDLGIAKDLFDDVIEPEAIVLHYEKVDDKENSKHENKDERSDS